MTLIGLLQRRWNRYVGLVIQSREQKGQMKRECKRTIFPPRGSRQYGRSKCESRSAVGFGKRDESLASEMSLRR